MRDSRFGGMVIVGVIASSFAALEQEAERDFVVSKMVTMTDMTRYVVAEQFPATQAEVLASHGYRDIASYRSHVEDEGQAMRRKAVRAAHETLLVFGTLAISGVAGFLLLVDGQLTIRKHT